MLTKTRSLRGSLAEQAYLKIRDRILRGDLPLGSELSRRKLGREYGVSLVPVMEALQRLENEGLVESWPRVGTRVKIPSARDIREQDVMREALECQAARLFSETAGADDRRELTLLATQLDEMRRQLMREERTRDILIGENQLHMGFHQRLAQCTGCGALVRAIEVNQMLVFKWLFDTAYERPPVPPGWHQHLMSAVAGNDAGIAEEAMRAHVRHGQDAVLKAISPLFGLDTVRNGRFSRTGEAGWRSR